MLFYIIFVITHAVIAVQADLSCLGWGLISPAVGIFCFFEPTYFQAAENKTVTAVEEAVQSAEDLVKFDLTHNPAVVTYNFIEQTNQGGVRQGGQYLKDIGQDYEDVAIGFGKETSNQILTIMELVYWNDLSLCLISGAASLALHSQKRMVKRVGLHSASAAPKGHGMSMLDNDTTSITSFLTNHTGSTAQPQRNEAVAMAHTCLSDKFKQLAKPATFHINGKKMQNFLQVKIVNQTGESDTNQKIGSTISDLAAFLIPIGAEEKAAVGATEALEGAVDLAIPGSESTTRVVKMISENTGDHFANEAEAKSVAEKMKEKSWVKENCGICGNSPALLGNLIAKRRRRDGYSLVRRGNVMASCCRLPPVKELEGAAATEVDASKEPKSVYDPARYKHIQEADLVAPPVLQSRNVQLANDVKALSHDLDTISTGLVSWSPELTRTMGSDELLSTLRKVFTGKPSNPIAQGLKLYPIDGGYRRTSNSIYWIHSENDALKPLQDWVNAAAKDCVNTVANLKGWTEERAYLKGKVDFFYTEPGDKALEGYDARGFHFDNGIMQFAVADVPGLIVADTASKTASRVPIAKNAFHLLKARKWSEEALLARSPKGPTWHSVFGPEMAKEGRVSVIVSVWLPEVRT